MRRSVLAFAALAVLASCIVVVAVGCGGADAGTASPSPTGPPAVPADITGTIHDLSANADPGLPTLLVVDDGAMPGAPDRAWVTVTPDTVVWMLKGGRGSGADLGAGQMVSVWFDGPVRESYPIQADAGAVRILLED
jgi:hypothetical protein